MRIDAEELPRKLDQALSPTWLIAGDEGLLVGEAADAVRARARTAGFAARELFFTDRSFDWSELLAASASLSLFAERRILEVRMPTPRPGKEGGAALAKLATAPAPDTLLLVVTTRPEKDTWSSAWFKAFEKHGMIVQSRPVEIGRLPQWIAGRAARQGLTIDAEAAELLAERVEGNLLAAQQEILNLALLHPGAAIGTAEVQDAVANSARYDVYKLGEAALEGDAARSLRILEGLRAEGTEPPLILWAISRELRAIAARRANPDAPAGFGQLQQRHDALVKRAVVRAAGRPLGPLFVRAARVDRQIKGHAAGDPWTTLTALVADLAGAGILAAPAA
ncbi:MAG: DNA polymerase III subunit delta [Steroidobacteraceae bacterium]